jgi:hypothetical protein
LTAAKPEPPTTTPKPDFKTAAADKTETGAPTEATPAAAPTKPEPKPAAPKQEEFVGEKLRTKSDVLGALKKGGRLKIENGLWRLIRADGSKQRVSKRRAVVLREQKAIIADGEGYVLAPEGEKKAEPQSEASTRDSK